MEIVVQDDGPGLPPGFEPSRFGVGLRTTQARLAALYGDVHSFRIENVATGGTSVVLSLPWRVDERSAVAS
jgi:glucose-6-phosphate-specific signal transduction histidine kinase